MAKVRKIVIELAKPVLSFKAVKNGFGRYVKYWLAEGYSWDGNCKCTTERFSCEVPIHSLEVKVAELENEVSKLLEK